MGERLAVHLGVHLPLRTWVKAYRRSRSSAPTPRQQPSWASRRCLPTTILWARFDEALRVVRALLRGEPVPAGKFYDHDELRLDPLPPVPPQVWFGSWGSTPDFAE